MDPVDVRRFLIRRLRRTTPTTSVRWRRSFGRLGRSRGVGRRDRPRTQAHERRRAEIAAVIASQQERRQAPPRARGGQLLADRPHRRRGDRPAGRASAARFTLLKALTALKLAEQVSRDHKVPAVAIFWIDAEDHDWEEVRS